MGVEDEREERESMEEGRERERSGQRSERVEQERRTKTLTTQFQNHFYLNL